MKNIQDFLQNISKTFIFIEFVMKTLHVDETKLTSKISEKSREF